MPEPGYFQQPGDQITSNDTNDFFYALCTMLVSGLNASGAGTVIRALPIQKWPDHPRVRFSTSPLSTG